VSQVRSIRKPDKSQLETLKNWLIRKDGGGSFLEGSESLSWAESDIDEYACLATVIETDIFTTLISKIIVTAFPWFFHGKKRKTIIEQSSSMRSYGDNRINTASNIISVVISSTLPVLAIFVLNSRESTTDRLWSTVLFTGPFAAALGIFNSTKRAEILAATATYVHHCLGLFA
jgi:sorbitol-specific phosphotransferase system component IIC